MGRLEFNFDGLFIFVHDLVPLAIRVPTRRYHLDEDFSLRNRGHSRRAVAICLQVELRKLVLADQVAGYVVPDVHARIGNWLSVIALHFDPQPHRGVIPGSLAGRAGRTALIRGPRGRGCGVTRLLSVCRSGPQQSYRQERRASQRTSTRESLRVFHDVYVLPHLLRSLKNGIFQQRMQVLRSICSQHSGAALFDRSASDTCGLSSHHIAASNR